MVMNPIEELLMEEATRRGRPPALIPDSYYAEKRDLNLIRRIAKRHGISKAAFIRASIKLGLAEYVKQQGDT